ncbi:MAG TPA: RodZ domain-containing protein [Thermoanaerobaculia bacterium]|nr:RodZ domain-containing protein [Thermoanaerobaculia bacterium]
MRRQRELRGITIREISDRTKISGRFLEAIERDDHGSLPAPVFTRGFLREYARELGLDPDEIVSRYMQLVHAVEQREEHEQEEMRQKIGSAGPLRWEWLLFIAIVILLVVAAIAFWSRRGRDRSADQEVKAAVPVAEAGDSPAEVPGPAEPEPEPAPIRFEVRAVEDSWLVLSVDGTPEMNGTLRQGEQRVFTGEQEVTIESAGNAGGLEITINGVGLEPLGRSGQVIRGRTFDLQFVERLRGEASQR